MIPFVMFLKGALVLATFFVTLISAWGTAQVLMDWLEDNIPFFFAVLVAVFGYLGVAAVGSYAVYRLAHLFF